MAAVAGKTRRLHVLTLTDQLGIGGAERLAAQTIAGLDRERFERTLCLTRELMPSNRSEDYARATIAEMKSAGVRVIRLNRRSKLHLPAWGPLFSFIRKRRVDVLHAHKFGANVSGTIIGRLTRVPVVIAHEHTWSFEGEPLRRFLDRELIARGCDAFIAVSREDRRKMIEIEGITPEDIVFVPNGIAPPPSPSGRDVRQELGIDPSDPVLGTVCSIRPQKALDVLIRSAAILREEFPRLRLLVVGEGDSAPYLKLIDELDLRDTVTLTGIRQDVPDVLQAIDVAVSSSDFEGSPLAVMEYMAAGKPVVATAVGGVPDLIDDGVHGFLVPPQDSEALAAATAQLLRDADRAAEMGERGRVRRELEFSLDTTVKTLEDLYERLYAASSRRRERGLADGGAGRAVVL
jgi:glycosyltransferase involved in cell wall biosynthesis